MKSKKIEQLSKMNEQRELYFSSLDEETKKEYFSLFFINEIISSLKKKRKELNISQAKIAKIMDVKQSYISKLENYSKVPTLTTVAKYCYALNFSFDQMKELSDDIVNFSPIKDKKIYTYAKMNSPFQNSKIKSFNKNSKILNNELFSSLDFENISKNRK